MPKKALSKKKKVTSNLPIIECVCGAQILLVPDARQMSEAIEAHVEAHVKKIENQKEANVEAERIRDDLIAKAFSKACDE